MIPRMKIFRPFPLPLLLAGISIATFLPACSQSDLANSHKAAQEIHEITSTATPPSTASPAIVATHQLVQGVSPAIPFGSQALAIIAALSGAAGTIIQTFRKQSSDSKHQKAIAEIAGNLTIQQQSALTAGTKSIVHKSVA